MNELKQEIEATNLLKYWINSLMSKNNISAHTIEHILNAILLEIKDLSYQELYSKINNLDNKEESEEGKDKINES